MCVCVYVSGHVCVGMCVSGFVGFGFVQVGMCVSVYTVGEISI